MLNNFIEIIKNTVITTVGLIVGLFGVDNTDFLKATDVNLQTAQEQAINLSDFSQANILEAVSGETPAIIDETITTTSEESQTTETVPVTTTTQDGTEYFVKENIPSAIFARPESLITKAVKVEEKLITLGEGASEDTRAINPIKSTITKKEIDVAKILNTDFDKFDSKLQITEITEDENNFYVSYQYVTLAIENRVWDEFIREKNISIAKNILNGKDLSEYLSEELAEVIDTEIVYLKEVQEIQKIKKAKADKLAQAETKKRTVASAYSSLIGKVLQVEESEFGDFEPIVKPQIKETTIISDIVIGGETTTTTTTATTTETTATTTPVVETTVEDKVTSNGVVDNQAPLIVIQGNNPALIQIGSSYVDLGARVSDNISEGLGVNIGGDVVDTETKGSYFVVYSATDEAGNTATATREVIVYDYGLVPDVEQVVDTTPIGTVETTTLTPAEEEEIITTPTETEEATITPEEVATTTLNEEIAITTPQVGIIENILEVATNVIDTSAEAVQETIDVAVEVTVDTIDTSAEAVQETVDTAFETTAEVIGDSVNAVIETTSEVAEQVTAMILSINIRELLGNIGAAGDGQITQVFTNSLDKSGEVVYRNINKIINKTKEFIFDLIDLSPFVLEETSSPVTEGEINIAQILSTGIYGIIGNMADSSYGAFNFIWKRIKNFSGDNSLETDENVGTIVESVSDISLNEDSEKNTFVRFIIFSAGEAKRIVLNTFEKISGGNSLASIKYSNKEFVLEEMQENDASKMEILKNKISDFSNIMKDGFSKTKEFFKETSPTIRFKEIENE
ncbi:DUF5011 domain-containing protein [Patescibacteria group bacterium]|nr:DUF5011 domain-containing protein [Patescibacteria group bacterium]